MPALTVPVPTLDYQPGLPEFQAKLEEPVQVGCGPVLLPDGHALEPGLRVAAGLFLYRRPAAAGPDQIWDEGTKEWKPDPGVIPPGLGARPLAFRPGASSPWQSLLVAAGAQDKNGADQFQKATGGFPRYFVRAQFAGEYAGAPISGISAASAALQFTRARDTLWAGIEVGDGETPADATQVRLFLRNPALQEIGAIGLASVGGDAGIEIAQKDPGGAPRASLRLLPTGEIALNPAPGRTIQLSAPVETQVLTFEPPGGGARSEIRLLPTGIEIVQWDSSGAFETRIHLKPEGEIRLTPSQGRRVIVEGEIETGRIFYQPEILALPKRYLP